MWDLLPYDMKEKIIKKATRYTILNNLLLKHYGMDLEEINRLNKTHDIWIKNYLGTKFMTMAPKWQHEKVKGLKWDGEKFA